MNFSNNNLNIRPAQQSHLLEMALRELHIEREMDNSVHVDEDADDEGTLGDNDRSFLVRRSIDERVLAPRHSSLENSLSEQINTSVPSLDEIVIRQRGRPKKPAKISWSPIKSPLFKTPTKNTSTLHMSLLSPSPAKKLFTNNNNSGSTSMILRNSPRKRILTNDPDPSSSSTPNAAYSTPTKRLRFTEDRSMSAVNSEIPLNTLLKGLSHDQLIEIIQGISAKDQDIEKEIRNNIPIPDIRPLEEELCSLRKSIMRSLPRSRLSISNKTDSSTYSRASPHLSIFKKALINHCKVLSDSHHFDALIDYVLIAWTYVRGLPIWDEPSHNLIRRDCFKLLTLNARNALRLGGMNLGNERIKNFRNKFKSMVNDFEELGRCKEALNNLAERVKSNSLSLLSNNSFN